LTVESGELEIPQFDVIDKLIHEPARLLIMTHLYFVESADFVYLMNQTGLTFGNLSSHMSKLAEAGYIILEKSFVDNRPNTRLSMTEEGRKAFTEYRKKMKAIYTR
jgi:DNA-binding MarR family transcriptional regulator